MAVTREEIDFRDSDSGESKSTCQTSKLIHVYTEEEILTIIAEHSKNMGAIITKKDAIEKQQKKLRERPLGGEFMLRYSGILRSPDKWPNYSEYHKHCLRKEIATLGKAEKDYKKQVALIEEQIRRIEENDGRLVSQVIVSSEYQALEVERGKLLQVIQEGLEELRSILILSGEARIHSSSVDSSKTITSRKFLDAAILSGHLIYVKVCCEAGSEVNNSSITLASNNRHFIIWRYLDRRYSKMKEDSLFIQADRHKRLVAPQKEEGTTQTRRSLHLRMFSSGASSSSSASSSSTPPSMLSSAPVMPARNVKRVDTKEAYRAAYCGRLQTIILAGPPSTGKTCLIMRYVAQTYTDSYIFSIGDMPTLVDVTLKELVIRQKILDLNELQLKYRFPARNYYKPAHTILICFDQTSDVSFNDVEAWLQDAERHAHEGAVIILVITKHDLDDERQISDETIKALADTHGIKVFYTSAKTGENVDALFEAAARGVIKASGLSEVKLSDDSSTAKSIHEESPDTSRACLIQ